MYGYGELTYDFGSGLALALRSLVNPVDLSARISPGVSWNVFQGFTLLGYASVQTGDPGDTYPWDPPADTDSAASGGGGTEASGTGTFGGLSAASGAGGTGLAIMLGCSVVY